MPIGTLKEISFSLNSQHIQTGVAGDTTALALLRDILQLRGTKEGCGIGECGACTIQVDGMAVNACLMLACQLDGREVITVEGLTQEQGLHPIQQAFLDNHAVQCGFCTPGLLMSTHALLSHHPAPDAEKISSAIAGNLCRCTGYHHITAAVTDAARHSCGQQKPSCCNAPSTSGNKENPDGRS